MASNKRYDVVIVGGGPAGTTFAHQTAKRGQKVLLLEKNPVPHPKVCGGVLSPRCIQAFDDAGLSSWVDKVPAQHLTHLEVELFSGESLDIPFPSTAPFTRVVNRVDLDATLWEAAIDAGAEVRDSTVVADLVSDSDGWRILTKDGEEFRARFLAGADGRNSFVGAKLNLPVTNKGRSLCFQYRLQKHQFCKKGVHFFIFPHGYCGLSVDGTGFAHLDIISLNGGENEKALFERLKTHRSAFVKKMESAEFVSERPVTRSPIGRGSRKRPKRTDLVLLGDARGWVEPFTGEGIFLAVESAMNAAKRYGSSLKSRHTIPRPSKTNRLVAHAIESPFMARCIVRFLRKSPPLARWMAKDVLW